MLGLSIQIGAFMAIPSQMMAIHISQLSHVQMFFQFNLFARFSFLRGGVMDLSALVAAEAAVVIVTIETRLCCESSSHSRCTQKGTVGLTKLDPSKTSNLNNFVNAALV